MKILIAPDSFKDSLNAIQVAHSIKLGIQKIFRNANFELIPMADGGEGTVNAIIEAINGTIVKTKVHDPLMREIESFFGISGDGTTAIIEMAAASGIELLAKNERNPWITSSFGTGELIKKALDHNCKNIIIGIGGSATNDCGVGMASALGVKFLNEKDEQVPTCGGELHNIRIIDVSNIDKRIFSTKIIAACDVTNPLTGKEGASAIFGPQKGADSEMVVKLDANLSYFASLIKKQLGKDIEWVPGAGAAGGLGAGLMIFLNAELKKGFEIISQTINLQEKIKNADIVITGEGKVDKQTQYGKTAFGITQIAKMYQKPVILIAGTIGEDADILYNMGVDAMISIVDKPMSLEEALKTAPKLIEKTGEKIARLLQMGGKYLIQE